MAEQKAANEDVKIRNASSLAAKIPDEELRQFAAGESREPLSVIIELDIVPQRVEIFREKVSGKGGYRVAAEDEAQQHDMQNKIAATKDFLEGLQGSDPVWLKSARAFVVNADADALKEIAGFPFTKRIRLNRHL